MWLAAERASISRTTLSKIEQGDEGVSMGSYARIFFILSLLSQLSDCADLRFDPLGLGLEAESLPKRIHVPRRRK
jgi:transcriptional regulator with XRE-family HTH domain